MAEILRGKGDMFPEREISLQEILVRLLDSKDVELKTEILKPKDFSGLEIYALGLRSAGYIGSARLIKRYIKIYRINMVSFDRKSRTEIVKAVSSLLDKETIRMSLGERLTTNLK